MISGFLLSSKGYKLPHWFYHVRNAILGSENFNITFYSYIKAQVFLQEMTREPVSVNPPVKARNEQEKLASLGEKD